MEQVLVVEQDVDLQGVLGKVLKHAGYRVVMCSDMTVATGLLHLAPRPLVVILSHGERSQEALQLLMVAHTLPAHAYVLLSSHPQQAPLHFNPHTQAFVPVVPMPLEVDLLLARVAEATWRLHAVAGPLSAAAG
jgi:DNA-binding NtrC family response regulator